jgi:aminoglycoside phosphotransferase (APT) family kinase protein
LHTIVDVKTATIVWEKALANPSLWNNAPVWIHADLHAGNILVKESKITAVIDFGMAGIGDPACDIMTAWTMLSDQTRTIFRSIVNVDNATWERGRGWALSFGLIALPSYKDTNPVLANIALNTINEVLADT